jgi:hypothetical protein
MEKVMLRMLVVVDWMGDVALADYEAPESAEDFEQVESDVRDAHEALAEAEGGEREPGPWVLTGEWVADPDDPIGAPELKCEWRRLTAEEAVKWATEGRLWPVPAYLVGVG